MGEADRPDVVRGRLIVLCGLPGSGKTTVARELANVGAIRLCSDEWMAALEIDLYDEAYRRRDGIAVVPAALLGP